MAGFLVATEIWQDMQVLVAGNVIKFPGAGFVWQVEHGKPERQVRLVTVGNQVARAAHVARDYRATSCFTWAAGGWLLRPGVWYNAKRHCKQSKIQRHNKYSRDPSQKPPLVSRRAQRKSELCTASHYYDLFSFLPTTSSMLVPRSLSITMAALRPGWPVTDPPGAVVPPVW